MRKLWNSFLLSILATVSFSALAQEKGPVVRFDPALDDIVAPGAKVEKVAGNFGFTEGPVWVRQGGYLLFSDIPSNVINKWNPADGKVSVFLGNPNGLALSADEKIFYVNSSADRKIFRYEVKPDDTIANGQLFVDMTGEKEPGNPDGMKVDEKGNLYSTGAGGIWVISPQGRHLTTLVFPEQPANLAFGDPDGKTLYVTARSGLYWIRLKVAGVRP